MPQVLIIEHQSLFTSLCEQQLSELLDEKPTRCEATAISEVDIERFSHILLETGSSSLDDFPLSAAFLAQLQAKQNMLAVGPAMNVLAHWQQAEQLELAEWLLGHQADCIVAGGKHDLLQIYPRQFPVIFYQKWVIRAIKHSDWIVTARDIHQQVVAIRHRSRPWEGVQFHPCSWGMPQRDLFWKTWLEKEEQR